MLMPLASKNRETILNNNGGPSRRKVMPPGWQFSPNDQELLFHFLMSKDNAQTVLPNIINEVDLCSCRPDDFASLFSSLLLSPN